MKMGFASGQDGYFRRVEERGWMRGGVRNRLILD